MIATHLECTLCENKYELEDYNKCNCGGILEVIYNYSNLDFDDDKISQKISSLLPIDFNEKTISLNEGDTPLLKASNLSKNSPSNNIYVKDETRNPTGSFKDRPISIGINKAREFNKNTIVLASTGNASSSAGAYAAKAGMDCVVFIPEKTPIEKLKQAKAYGAKIYKIRGDYSNAYNMAIKAGEKFNWYNLSTTYLNPYTVEGNKTVAYELISQLDKIDYIFIPVGAGPLLFGIYKGFKEMKKFNYIDYVPKLIAVQPEGCAPIVKSFSLNKKKVSSWDKDVNTRISGINDPLIGYEQDGTITLDCIYKSNGYALSVSDKEIIDSMFELSSLEGIFVEGAGSAGYAGLKKLQDRNIIKSNDKIVIIATGSGLKDMEKIKMSHNLISSLKEINK